jgi:hypothetical protein
MARNLVLNPTNTRSKRLLVLYIYTHSQQWLSQAVHGLVQLCHSVKYSQPRLHALYGCMHVKNIHAAAGCEAANYMQKHCNHQQVKCLLGCNTGTTTVNKISKRATAVNLR